MIKGRGEPRSRIGTKPMEGRPVSMWELCKGTRRKDLEGFHSTKHPWAKSLPFSWLVDFSCLVQTGSEGILSYVTELADSVCLLVVQGQGGKGDNIKGSCG